MAYVIGKRGGITGMRLSSDLWAHQFSSKHKRVGLWLMDPSQSHKLTKCYQKRSKTKSGGRLRNLLPWFMFCFSLSPSYACVRVTFRCRFCNFPVICDIFSTNHQSFQVPLLRFWCHCHQHCLIPLVHPPLELSSFSTVSDDWSPDFSTWVIDFLEKNVGRRNRIPLFV